MTTDELLKKLRETAKKVEKWPAWKRSSYRIRPQSERKETHGKHK